MTKEEKTLHFIEEAKKKFPQFNYDKVQTFNNKKKDTIIIVCPIHGEFETLPTNFLHSKYGCSKCARDQSKKHNNVLNHNTINDLHPISNPVIVSKNFLIGTIYCFINKINNKLYIGETVRSDYNERFNEHRNKAKNGINSYFYKAIRKYGWDSFDLIILQQTEILENTDENKCYLTSIVNELEKYYINKYNTSNHTKGYNLTEGGDGISGYKHSEETKKLYSQQRLGEKHWKYGKFNNGGDIILQFDLDFHFIKEWPSMCEINRQLGYNANNISRCCNNKLDTYKGFIWVKKEDYFEGYLSKYKSRAKCKSNDKTVLQYDFLGNFIAEYISCAAAGKALGKLTVSSAANGRDSHLYGYIWIYKNEYSEDLLKIKLEKIKDTFAYKKFIKTINNDRN